MLGRKNQTQRGLDVPAGKKEKEEGDWSLLARKNTGQKTNGEFHV